MAAYTVPPSANDKYDEGCDVVTLDYVPMIPQTVVEFKTKFSATLASRATVKKMGEEISGGGGGKSGCRSAVSDKSKIATFHSAQIQSAYQAQRSARLKAVKVTARLKTDMKRRRIYSPR